MHHLCHRLLAVGAVLAKERLLTPRPHLYGGRTNLGIDDDSNGIVVGSVGSNRGIREHTLYALESSVVLLLPAISVASYMYHEMVVKKRGNGRKVIRCRVGYVAHYSSQSARLNPSTGRAIVKMPMHEERHERQ